MDDEGKMATKRGGEANLTIAILREIRDAARETNARIDSLRVEMHRGFDSLQTEMHQGFDLLGRRIDNVLLGEHRSEHQDLRGRVERIELHLGLRSQ
jgi:hypothetical protein